MTLQLTRTSALSQKGGNSIALSSFFSLSTTSNAAYLVVDALDRNEYTAAATGATGHFLANGKTLGLSSIGGDGRGAGIVYSWNASTHTYTNATYGSLSQLDWVQSTSKDNVTNLSFFATSNASLAQGYASNAYAMMQLDAAGYLGSITASTNPAASSTTPPQATPDAIAAAAESMVGQAWNEDGCWVLASTIAAETGAGLPVQSTAIGVPGAANGEWFALYDGPAGTSSSTWANLVSTGDIVAFETASGGGHITTCVSGSGSTAELVDNITYVNGSGAIMNPANDGSSSDIVIEPPHPASQEFAGVNPGNVVIYALDTPAVTDLVASKSDAAGTKITLSSLFSAADPKHLAVTSYQVYLTGKTDTLLVGSKATPNSAVAPITTSSLGLLSFEAGTTPGTDQIDVRASNGTYWGDWQSLTITDTSAAGKVVVASAVSLRHPELPHEHKAGGLLSHEPHAHTALLIAPSWHGF